MSKIIGNTTTTPVPRSDWAQTDKTKADFIRNKPVLETIYVKYDEVQTLTDEQKQQAQDNIGFSEEDALAIVMDLNLVSPVVSVDGSIYTDENGAMYSL